MKITRLRFLSMVSSSAALAAVSPTKLLGGSVTIHFSAAAFLPYKNTTFTIHIGGDSVKVNLDAVNARPPDGYTDQFSLVFSGPKSSKIAEGTYTVTHSGLNSFSLHVNPAGTRSDGKKLYRADFNVLKS